MALLKAELAFAGDVGAQLILTSAVTTAPELDTGRAHARTQALLTQAELAFIRQLHQPAPTEQRNQPRLPVDLGKQLSELLSHCAANEQLSLHAHIANQHLTFNLHLSQDEQDAPSLQLSAPQIFDEGEINRAWRSPLRTTAAAQQTGATWRSVDFTTVNEWRTG